MSLSIQPLDASHWPAAKSTTKGSRGATRHSSARRPVYKGVAEVSVYVAAIHRGRGIGRALLEELVAASERNGIWTLQAGIFLENVASLAIHHSLGFRQVGRRVHEDLLRKQSAYRGAGPSRDADRAWSIP